MTELPFSAPVRAWFESNFDAATPVQARGWPAIASGAHSLLLAPTGSGKTLAAFLWALDRVGALPADAPPGVRVLYVSPLKALAHDVERNLRAPLVGISRHAGLLGASARLPRVDLRTGDTPARERRHQAREPGDILVTTPESLYLILTSAAAATLATVHTVIIDEVHALAGSKRGAHLALSLERLTALCAEDPQRIGLSATVEPPAEAARFLGGARAVQVIDALQRPRLQLRVCVPVADMEQPVPVAGGPLLAELASAAGAGEGGPPAAQRGIWEALYPAVLAELRGAASTIVFVNSRALAERMVQRLNELAGEELAWAHHGSVSHERRARIEEGLKAGTIRAIVATSTMELGVDMGSVDRVILVESPGSVARGLQRIGRAGHQVGAVSAGRIYPKFRGDLLEASVVAELMLEGRIEALSMPRNPLDVLAQQLAAMCCGRDWTRSELAALVRRAGPYRELGDAALDAVLEMLSGKYAALGSLDLRPRLSWDRATDTLSARRGTAMLVRVNAGTIPDRGLYAVHLGADGPRLGELDEEMVFESRPGEVFVLGASSWRIEQITRDRVLVSPAPGEPGKLPFWRGDGPGRPYSLGRAIGARTEAIAASAPAAARARLAAQGILDEHAATNLVDYVHEQLAHCGAVPGERCIVVERFRDELGDWRVCILSPFGARVHAPWAMALERRLAASDGFEVQLMYADDGIVVRFADAEELPALETLFPAADEVQELVVEQLGDTARFAALFRENAARALLLPRRSPGSRSPLWAQRQKSARLLAQVRGVADFPVLLETYREALSDAFDLAGLGEVLTAVGEGRIRVHEVHTPRASPFARSLVFAYVAAYLYEQDAPLAERRAQALTIDRSLLAELVGQEALRELLDEQVLARVEAMLQGLDAGHQARDADELADLLSRVGDLDEAEAAGRCTDDPGPWLQSLARQRRAVRLRIAGGWRWVAAADAGLYRDALGCQPPGGLPEAMLAPVDAALERLVARFARRRGPFAASQLAQRYALSAGQVAAVLGLLQAQGRVVHGEMRPQGLGPEWCDLQVLQRLKRETLAQLRRQVAAVEPHRLAEFLPRWQGHGAQARGAPGGAVHERLLECIVQLQGLALPWSLWRDQVLPARVGAFSLDALERLCASGELLWAGQGALGPRDGRVVFYQRGTAPLLLDGQRVAPALTEPLSGALLEHLQSHGACFLSDLEFALRGQPGFGATALQSALDELMWAGCISNDTLAPLQGLALRAAAAGAARRAAPRAGSRRRAALGSGGGRWSCLPWASAAGVDATERAVAQAEMLLARYGIVSREMALAEGLRGGFAPLYTVLRRMEETGRVRRGHFIEGLSGAQFAPPGAVDMLRDLVGAEERLGAEGPPLRLLAAQDPANPYGALLPWPAPRSATASRPRRGAGAWLVLHGGRPLLYFAGSSRVVTRFEPPGAETEAAEQAILQAGFACLAGLPRRGRGRGPVIEFIDGEEAHRSALRETLLAAGFVHDYRGYTVVGGTLGGHGTGGSPTGGALPGGQPSGGSTAGGSGA